MRWNTTNSLLLNYLSFGVRALLISFVCYYFVLFAIFLPSFFFGILKGGVAEILPVYKDAVSGVIKYSTEVVVDIVTECWSAISDGEATLTAYVFFVWFPVLTGAFLLSPIYLFWLYLRSVLFHSCENCWPFLDTVVYATRAKSGWRYKWHVDEMGNWRKSTYTNVSKMRCCRCGRSFEIENRELGIGRSDPDAK